MNPSKTATELDGQQDLSGSIVLPTSADKQNPVSTETANADQNAIRNPIDLLADEYSARLRNGESPSIEEFIQRAPEHESGIRALFPTIALIERMSHQEYSKRRPKRRTLEPSEIIGDFRILREIGRGGMGIVYDAMQRSLERRVALKVLGSGIADSPQQLKRFRREAESAARLHHTNIVPVYGIGEEDGIHFYAMQFIDGLTLADAIDLVRHRRAIDHTVNCSTSRNSSDLTGPVDQSSVRSPREEPLDDNDPTLVFGVDSDVSGQVQPISDHKSAAAGIEKAGPREGRFKLKSELQRDTTEDCLSIFSNRDTPEFFRVIARLVAKVADALSYAHEHGVLHRDIKPSNLMLDRAGDVWIMDFGLVKLSERHDLTQTGEIVGTVRYMAPEQLSGQAETTTDIYSLGLTLYEILTLKPAFGGDSMVTLSQRLQGCEIPRPRSINSNIPRDLETIILKATVREPAGRYSSAATFAEDLRRFCEDRPVLARRSTYTERLWRWTRRNPALAVTTSSIVLLLGLIAIVASVGRFRVESALFVAKNAQQRAEVARTRAEKNLDSAIGAFDSILENVMSRGVPRSLAMDVSLSEDGLAQTPLAPADALLLDKLLEFYRSFAQQSEDSARLRQRIADAHHRAGTILVRLGRLTEAEKDLRKAIELLSTSRESDAENIELVVKSASIQNEIGELILRRGEFSETFLAHLEARAMLLDLPESRRTDPAVRFELARATDLFSSIDVRSGTDEGPAPPPHKHRHDAPPPNGVDPQNSRTDFPLREKRRPGPPPIHGISARLKNALPMAFKPEAGDLGDDLALTLSEAVSEFRSLTSEFPENVDYQFRLAQCLRHRMVHAFSRKDLKVAEETFAESVHILDRLATKAPDDPKYQFELADTLTQAPRAQSSIEAKASLDRAEQIASSLAARFPNVSEYQLLLGSVLARRASVQSVNGDTSSANESLRRSIEILRVLAKQFPDQGVIQIPLARSSQQLGDLLRTTAESDPNPTQRLELSRSELQSAIDRFEEYLAMRPSSPSRPGSGHFNTSIKSNLYLSLAETLTQLKLPEEAERVKSKAIHLRRPGPPFR